MVQSFANFMFRHGLISTVNKPTRVTRNTATAIDNIIANSVINSEFKTGIFKTDTSPYSSYLNLLSMLPRPGNNSYTNEITQVIQ